MLTQAEEIVRDMLHQSASRLAVFPPGSVPEDAAVIALCERHGFGAVMDAAARAWRARDPIGAFLVGPCIRTAERAEDDR
jgi:hypothetical protein